MKVMVIMYDVMSRRVASNLETKHMREVLTNFRINSSDVTVISNMKASARPELWTAFRLAVRHIYHIIYNLSAYLYEIFFMCPEPT